MEKLSIATTNTPLPVRAAQYVRMSTEHQQYSPENQLEVIRQYAASHQMEIVREYSDHGRSGLNIAGREGPNTLMADVEGKRTDFSGRKFRSVHQGCLLGHLSRRFDISRCFDDVLPGARRRW